MCTATTYWSARPAAVPPLAAAGALAVGLGVLKRVVDRHHRPQSQAHGIPTKTVPGKQLAPVTRTGRSRLPVTPEHAEAQFAPMLAAGTLPSLRAVRSQLHVGTDLPASYAHT